MDRFARFGLELIPGPSFTGPKYDVLIDGVRTGCRVGPETLEDFMYMGLVKPGDWTVLESVYHEELNNVRQLNIDAHDLVAFFKTKLIKGLRDEL